MKCNPSKHSTTNIYTTETHKDYGRERKIK